MDPLINFEYNTPCIKSNFFLSNNLIVIQKKSKIILLKSKNELGIIKK